MKKILLLIALALCSFVFINVYGQQQPENPGFEFWEEYGFGPDTLEPVNWNSLKSSDGGDLINAIIPVTLERSTDAHSGNYSAKLKNDTILIFVAPGAVTNGRVHATLPPADAYVYTIDSLPEYNTPFIDKPDSLTLWAKYFPTDNDIARITAVLHTDTAKVPDPDQTNWVAVATINISEQYDNWTKFSVPFVYLSDETPEYLLFAMFAGDAANSLPESVLYLDDIEFIYYNTGIKDARSEDFHLAVKDNQLIIQINPQYTGEIARIEISDIAGKKVFTQKFKSEVRNLFTVDLPAGVYIYKIAGKSFNRSQKFIKN